MTRDVYTEPQSTTYLLWKQFLLPTERGDVLAISVPTTLAFSLNTLYALITIYLFNAIWNVLLYAVMLLVPLKKGLAWNYILSVYWNSADPFAAWSRLTIMFQRMCLRSPRYFKIKDASAFWALILSFLALLTGLGSVAGGILVPPSMSLGNFAPVNPGAIWVPLIPEVGSLFARVAMIESPAPIRAIGSAEASRVTLRNKVSIYQEKTDASTLEKPDFFIRYHYNLTGAEFGMRKSLGLVHSVRGRCQTEYGWLYHSNSTPKVDVYRPWGFTNNTFTVPSKSGPGLLKLGFNAVIRPQDVKTNSLNTSFALIYLTGHLPSFSESSDAMYMTEMMSMNDSWSEMLSFRVKAERPVLSCWQESKMCIRGECGSVFDLVKKDVPPGLLMILARLQRPAMPAIANSLGPAALMSFFSPSPGITVDAASSSTFADMERLILGAYLWTRNILRDATMTDPVAGFKNAVLNDKGQQLRGSGDFVLEAQSVTAFSLTALVLIPALTVLFMCLMMICNYLVHPGAKTTTFRAQRERMVDLAMPNLYRVANMQEGSTLPWEYVRRLHPVPTTEDEEMSMPLLEDAKVSQG